MSYQALLEPAPARAGVPFAPSFLLNASPSFLYLWTTTSENLCGERQPAEERGFGTMSVTLPGNHPQTHLGNAHPISHLATVIAVKWIISEQALEYTPISPQNSLPCKIMRIKLKVERARPITWGRVMGLKEWPPAGGRLGFRRYGCASEQEARAIPASSKYCRAPRKLQPGRAAAYGETPSSGLAQG